MLEHYLCCYCSFEQDDWASHLLMTEFIYNNVKHSSINMLFFEALYVYSSDLCFNIKKNILKRKTLTAQEQVKEMHKIWKLLEKNLTKIIKQQKNTIIRSILLSNSLLIIRFFWRQKIFTAFAQASNLIINSQISLWFQIL